VSSPTHRDEPMDRDATTQTDETPHRDEDGRGLIHRDSWELIPWLVTGRLRDAERARVEGHVAECEECRAEIVAQRALRERMAVDGPVTYSPAASFEKLWSRIEELEREVPATGRTDPDRHGHGRPRAATRAGQSSTLSRWLVAAVVVQSIALSWLVHGVLVDRGDREWQYRTVTSPATVVPSATRLRVIFARDITVSELQRILSAHRLSIVQGPAASEIFTLTPAEGVVPADTTLLLQQLRAEPAVRFVELAATSAFATDSATARPAPTHAAPAAADSGSGAEIER